MMLRILIVTMLLWEVFQENVSKKNSEKIIKNTKSESSQRLLAIMVYKSFDKKVA